MKKIFLSTALFLGVTLSSFGLVVVDVNSPEVSQQQHIEYNYEIF
jgi:hypothetical protein